jgi:predicted dehydrogenase
VKARSLKRDLAVAICGFGSIGRRHAANAARLGARVLVAAHTPGKADAMCRRLGYRNCNSAAEAIESADAVIVATPTDRHIALALVAARARKPIFIEKPLSVDRRGVARLIAESRGLVVEVGCQLRAHPALRILARELAAKRGGKLLAFRGCVGQRLDEWRPGTDYRTSYSADARRGGGALLDLIHEIDLVGWLCGPVERVAARLSSVSDLDLRAEDLANLLLECRGGAVGSLQLDMVSPVYRRSFEVVCARAVYEWDYAANVLVRRTPAGAKELWRASPGFERNDLFVAHLGHFFARARGGRAAPLCSLANGVAALDVALAAREAASANRWQRVRRKGQ